jgi:hypothetical protein
MSGFASRFAAKASPPSVKNSRCAGAAFVTMAGGTDVTHLPQALASVKQFVQERV